MNHRLTTTLLLFCLSNIALAAELTVSDPWVREAPPGAAALAAYMLVANPGDSEQVITAISSPISDHVEMHRTLFNDGVASMQQQPSIAIPAGGQLAFEPGGYHIMVMSPPPLKAGDRVPFTLQLGNGDSVTIDAQVRRVMGGKGHAHHHQH